MRRVIALHLVANAMLLWAAYYWLGVGESSTLRFVWSLVVACVTLGLALALHGGTLDYFRDPFSVSVRKIGARLPVWLGVFALGLAVYLSLNWLQVALQHPAFVAASWLTFRLRTPVKPGIAVGLLGAVFWLLHWAFTPALLLALAGVGKPLLRKWRYWIAALVLLLLAIDVPLRLASWAPHLKGFALELASFSVRALIAYLLFTAAWIALLYLSAGRMPGARAQASSSR